ncbi:biphenyl 2,3-dioxygenase [Endozoicomonas sp. OPT23]|uniref:GNAT family N-acetyltransferase n=1 Tax=Endozoicomonas sp. OPT23 TaxID=2072845 RepID=UPI00129A6ACF|nr:GNAT family N-acetyltransferase [Endozoicomonas sp. OPT23]MRI34229.1 biphenyl 2,3-dioxygenase [Endozoicomonas sp. OPT23]
MDIIKNTEPTDQDIVEIRDNLRAFNRPFLENIRNDQLAFYINDDSAVKVAGIAGRMRGNWLLVQYLWVSEPLKNQGLGSRLLKSLEDYAVEQGCHSVMLDTASFQAEPFYRKHGYKTEMTLEDNDFPTVFYMTKQLK